MLRSSLPVMPSQNLTPPTARRAEGNAEHDNLFIVSDTRMEVYISLVKNKPAIMPLIKTGIEIDLFYLLSSHFALKTSRDVTEITLLPPPPTESHHPQERFFFNKVFKAVLSGNFSNLHYFSHPYSLEYTQYVTLFNAHAEGRIQLTTLDLSQIGEIESAITYFLEKVKSSKFNGLTTLIVGGWKPWDYKRLSEIIRNNHLFNLQHFIWKNFTQDIERFPAELIVRSKVDNILNDALCTWSFVPQNTENADPAIKVYERLFPNRRT
jgi:hypothetical protein